MPKKATKKKATRRIAKKKVVKRRASPNKKVLLCPVCKSPHISIDKDAKGMEYSCLMCKYKGPSIVKSNIAQAKKIVEKRRQEVQQHHKIRSHARQNVFNQHLNKYDMRIWAGLMGIMVLVSGVILLSSKEPVWGSTLLIIGMIAAYYAEKI